MNNLMLEVLFVVVLATHHGVYCYTVTAKVPSIYTTIEDDHRASSLNRETRSAEFISNLFDGLQQGGDMVTGLMRNYENFRNNIPHHISDLIFGNPNNKIRGHKTLVRLRNHPLIRRRPALKLLVPRLGVLRNLVRPLLITRDMNHVEPPVKIVENDHPLYHVDPEEIIEKQSRHPILSPLKYLVPDSEQRQLIIKTVENPRLIENVMNIRRILDNINDILHTVVEQNVLRNTNVLPKVQDFTTIFRENPINGNPTVVWEDNSRERDDKIRHEQRRNWLLEQFNRLTNQYVRDIIIRPDIIDAVLSTIEEHTNHKTREQNFEVDVIFFDSALAYNNYILNERSFNDQAPEFPENGNIILIVVKFDENIKERLWIRNKQSTDVISHLHLVKIPENAVYNHPDPMYYPEQGPSGIDDLFPRIIGGNPATGSGTPVQSKGKRSLPYVNEYDEAEKNSDPEEEAEAEDDSEENE